MKRDRLSLAEQMTAFKEMGIKVRVAPTPAACSCGRTAAVRHDVYANPEDGYTTALQKRRATERPTPQRIEAASNREFICDAAGVPDGYLTALAAQREGR